jgi:flagellar biosynthesis protein FlhF
LREQDKQKYESFSAKKQREFINKAFERREMTSVKRPPTQVRYIEINDEAEHATNDSVNGAQKRIRNAAQEALRAAGAVTENPRPRRPKRPHSSSVRSPAPSREINALQSEISHLKGLLERFQNVPQSFVSMHPGAREGISYELSFMFEKMTRAGISPENTSEILKLAEQDLEFPQKENKLHQVLNFFFIIP